MNFSFKRSDFPDQFIFGTATSAYQIEGRSGGSGSTHWDSFAATPGNVVRGENGDRACDHYHRFEEDLDLVKQAGFDAYRFSTSWARVLPEGRGQINPEGLDFYDRLVDAMLERDIAPFATLYHWELPVALADLGGWRNPDIGNWFADFTQIIMQRIGDRVAGTAPVNEPWCVAWLSHFLGHHAPGLRDIRAAARAMHHVLVAQGLSIQAMRALGINNLGAIVNFEYAEPATDSAESRQAADLYDGIYNRWFLGALFNQRYPDNVLAGLEEHLPVGWQDDFDTIGETVDWVGINYYTRKRLIATDGSLFPAYEEQLGPLPKTTMGWEIFPPGLRHFLNRVQQDYAKGLPIYVTENGMSADDQLRNNKVDDPERIEFIDRHLTEVQLAMADGANIAGYFVWSLLDNYEWSLGYEKRFGLVHVDFETLIRTPKSSHQAFSRALTE